MPEVTKLVFSHKEVVTALLKTQNIHEGIWGLYVEFGIGAANFGPTPNDIQPVAIVPVVKIGLQQFDSITNISVDATTANPSPRKNKAVKTANLAEE